MQYIHVQVNILYEFDERPVILNKGELKRLFVKKVFDI